MKQQWLTVPRQRAASPTAPSRRQRGDPGVGGRQGLLASSAPSPAGLRLLRALGIFPCLALVTCPEGRLRGEHRPYRKLVSAAASPSCCFAAEREGSGR